MAFGSGARSTYGVVVLWLLGAAGGCAQEFTISLHTPDLRDASDSAADAADVVDGSTAADADGKDAAGPSLPDASGNDAGSFDAGSARSLRVRYDFSGSGVAVVDRVGTADAVALGGATLSGDGTITLDGEDDYIDMPNGLVSNLEALTVVAWFEWAGGVCWQRLFDFGSNDQGEDRVGRVETSLFFTPLVCGRDAAAACTELGSVQHWMMMDHPLPVGRWVQVALTVDPGADVMRLYVDGELRGEARVPFTLDAIDDTNVWLGRSQWEQDRNWTGRYDEFRLYDRALTPNEVRAAYVNGPDVL